jgi:hypothetical protein
MEGSFTIIPQFRATQTTKMSFAKDSASPGASSVASEDVPIQQVIFATQMGLHFEDLLDDDELEWSFEREALMNPVPKRIPKFPEGIQGPEPP